MRLLRGTLATTPKRSGAGLSGSAHVATPLSAVARLPWEQWAGALYDRAHATPHEADRDTVLDWFRAHSDFYANRLAGVRAWHEVPVLEKSDVSSVPVKGDGSERDTRTSGTTGLQVTIRNSWSEREFRRALLYRSQLFFQLPGSVNQLVFVDGDECMRATDAPKCFDYGGTRYSTWFAGALADPADVHRLLQAIRPRLVRGIASAIVGFIEDRAADLAGLGVEFVGPGGEYLLPEWRARMEDAFGARVLDRYGSTESGAIAWQCPHCDRYHANTDQLLLEDGADGLIVTPLFVASQPLLRYRLGDKVTLLEPDAHCPVRLPCLQIREARRDDWLFDGSGRRISPLGLQFEQVPGLLGWRVHQRTDGSIDLYLDTAPGCEPGPAMVEQLARQVPGRCVKLRRGTRALRRGGKFKRIVSDFDEAGSPVRQEDSKA